MSFRHQGVAADEIILVLPRHSAVPFRAIGQMTWDSSRSCVHQSVGHRERDGSEIKKTL